MSSDDDTPSLDKDKKDDKDAPSKSSASALTQKFRLFSKSKTVIKEGSVKVNDLSKLYNINTEKIEQALPEDSEDVESAVDALEDTNFKEDEDEKKTIDKDDVLKSVTQKFDNIELDNERNLNVREVTGKEIRSTFLEGGELKTVFAPTGFVDLRPPPIKNRPFSTYA